ncbi:MAG TPA: hypothetical protein V6D50_17275 [Chroococcales cyanobacterium]|jgi:hypothetical protein
MISTSKCFIEPVLAQASIKPQEASSSSASATAPDSQAFGQAWMYVSIVLILIMLGLLVYGKIKFDEMGKKLKFEQYKTTDLQKKLKLALNTIRKMEGNPDLVHSREFNLDYLRMRMDEEVFHFAIINQIKIKVKQLISVALRPQQGSQQAIGIASSAPRQVDEMFDVLYETESGGKRSMRVLFRIQIILMKLPTQATSATISQIIDCIETFLNPKDEHETWQPTIQGRIVIIRWDQKAKPTPLLVLQQSSEGVNVTLKTKRIGL